jgi:hypothetical protein
MRSCDCGASDNGKWAGVHTDGCASLETPSSLRAELEYAYRAIHFGFTYGTFDFSILKNRAKKFCDEADAEDAIAKADGRT